MSYLLSAVHSFEQELAYFEAYGGVSEAVPNGLVDFLRVVESCQCVSSQLDVSEGGSAG
jgi:hypothetical protein